jgi:hypothetical protein
MSCPVQVINSKHQRALTTVFLLMGLIFLVRFCVKACPGKRSESGEKMNRKK